MQSKSGYSLEYKDSSLQTKKIWKNVAVLTTVFVLNYSASSGLYALQSSLHREEGIGTTAASVTYITSTLTCLFLSPLLIKFWGQKWTIFASFISFFIWIAANGIGTWGSMITASIINGLFTAPVWAAEGSYTTELAKAYAKLHPEVSADRMCTLFFGIFSMQFGLSGVISDSIASSILVNSAKENFTPPTEEEIQENCGLNDCPWIDRNITYFDEPSNTIVWTLVGVYLLISLSAILLTAFGLDSLSSLLTDDQNNNAANSTTKEDIISALLSALKLMKHYRLWLLLPIDMYLALSYTFRIADFNGSWVTCAIGIWMVGLINIPGHITKIAVAPTTGYISKKIGRIVPMIFSVAITLISWLILLLWPVSGEDRWMFFLLPILFAIQSSTLDTIATSVHGIAFIDDTAAVYTCYNFFWAVFSAIPFGYSYYICSDTKLYIVMGTYVMCFVCYFILEWDIHRNMKKENNSADNIMTDETTGKDSASDYGTISDGKGKKYINNAYENQSYTKF